MTQFNRFFFLLILLAIGLMALSSPDLAAAMEGIVSSEEHSGQEEHAHSGPGFIEAPEGMVPTVQITSPLNGATLNTRDVEVDFSALNHVVGPIGTNHVHFHLDNDAIPFMFFNGTDPTQFGQQAVLFDFDLTSRATWVDSDTLRFNALSNGLHTLRAHLVDAQHNIFANPEATLTIQFTVDVPPDDLNPPDSLLFVKEQIDPAGMGRVFDNDPDIVSDLYLLTPATITGTVTQLTDVAAAGGGVSDPELSWDGTKVVFAMRQDGYDTWHIWEMGVDGSNLTQLTFDSNYGPVNDLDPVYLPDGRIMFASDRMLQRDEYNMTISTQLYTMNAGGGNITLVEPNPSHVHNPQVIRDGRIVFDRWDHLAGRNRFTNWHMNQDGSSGFVFFGGASPRGTEQLDNSQGVESRQLVDGTMVGIFNHRDQLPGVMAIYDNRNGDLEDLPKPIVVGPTTGFYRTPHPLTTNELVYSYSADPDPLVTQYGLYTMDWQAEQILQDDLTVSTAPGPGTNLSFRFYIANLTEASRVYIEVTGSADDNGASDDDDLWLVVNGIEYKSTLERKLDGDLLEGRQDTFRLDVDLPAGANLIQIATDETPSVNRVRIVRAFHPGTHTLLYDDPATNEISPIPVRARTAPPVYPTKVNPAMSWGTFLVRDISLRGDFRQANHDDPEGDPSLLFHLDLAQIQGLRVFQSMPRRTSGEDILAGDSNADPVRVLGVTTPNATGAVLFQAQAGVTTAWDVIDNDGSALVHERVWSLVQPGEIRACGGCHVPNMPFVQRVQDPFPAPTNFSQTRGVVYSWVDQVLPIVQQNCTSCHSGGAPAGGLDLTGDRQTYDDLKVDVPARIPDEYVNQGDSRFSFLFQLLTGNARGDAVHQARIDTINSGTDHTTMLTSNELYEMATWIDTGNGFAYLPLGEQSLLPEVVDIWPRDGAASVPDNTGISIGFNAPIDRATLVDGSTFTLELLGTGFVSGSFDWGTNRRVTFLPDTPLAAGTYEVSVSGSVLDIKDDFPGNALGTSFTSQFTVGGGSDVSGPGLLAFYAIESSMPLTEEISLAGPMVVGFDEVIDPGSVTDLTLYVTASNGAFIEGHVGVSADGKEAGFAPDLPFDVNETYTLHISGAIRDLAGNPLGSDTTRVFTIDTSPELQHHSLEAERYTGNAPEKITVSTDGSRILVGNQSSDSISLFDGANWDELARHTSSDNPYDLAFSPDNTVAYYIKQSNETIDIMNLATGHISATVTGMVNLNLMAINNAGTRLYVADSGDPDMLHEIDIELSSPNFATVINTLLLPKNPEDVQVSPDDNTLYLSTSQRVMVVNIPVWQVMKEIKIPFGGAGELALSPDQRTAVVPARYDDALQIVDLVAGRLVFEMAVGDYPESAVFSPDGRFLYVAEREDRTIAVIDTATWTVLGRLNTTGNRRVEGLDISPDGQHLFAVGDSSPGMLMVYHLADFSDITAPSMVQSLPVNGATGVPVHAPIQIEFSEAVDRLTINSLNVRLEEGGVNIGGDLRVSDDNQWLTFVPSGWLLPNTVYTMRLTTGVQDLNGNALDLETVFSFTTAAIPPAPVLSLWANPPAGNDPRGAAVTPDGLRAFSTDYWDETLSIFDTTTWDATYLDMESNVTQVAVTTDSLKAYVLRPVLDDIVVIDLATDIPIDMDPGLSGLQGIPVGDWPDSFLVHPTLPILYVINRDSSDVSVIDTSTDTETARWYVNGVDNTDMDAHGAAISPDGAHLFVTSRYRLSQLSTTDGTLINLYDGLPGWSQYGVVIVDGGNQVWFISESTEEIVGFDLRLEEMVARIPLGNDPNWAVLSPDGETIYVTNEYDGGFSVINWRTATVVATYNNLGEAYYLALSPDGQRLHVANNASNALLVYELADLSDVTAPTVKDMTPVNGAGDIGALQPLIVEFDEAFDRASVNSSTFEVAAGPAAQTLENKMPTLGGSFIFEDDNKTFTFLPATSWAASMPYTIELGTITDMAGNPLVPVNSTFTAADVLPASPITDTAISYGVDEAWGMDLSPDGSLLAAGHRWQDLVTFLDPATLTPVGTAVTVDGGPRSVTFSPDGSELYVGNEDDSTVVVIDVASRTIAHTFFGVLDPEEITVRDDGNALFVTGYSSGGVHLIDLVSDTVTPQWLVASNPGKPAYGPDGLLYVPAYDHLWRQNPDTSWSSIYVGSGYLVDVAFSGDGRHAYISANWTDQIKVVDLHFWMHVYSISVGDEPRHIEQSADGRLALLVNAQGSTVEVIDLLTLQTVQVQSVPTGYLPRVVWDEAGSQFWVGDTISDQVKRFAFTYATALPLSAVPAIHSGSNLQISWADSPNCGYEVHQGTDPYFEMGATSIASLPIGTSIYTVPSVVGNPATNYFFIVEPVGCSLPRGNSGRVGEFDFAMVPGAAGTPAVETGRAEAGGDFRIAVVFSLPLFLVSIDRLLRKRR